MQGVFLEFAHELAHALFTFGLKKAVSVLPDIWFWSCALPQSTKGLGIAHA